MLNMDMGCMNIVRAIILRINLMLVVTIVLDMRRIRSLTTVIMINAIVVICLCNIIIMRRLLMILF